MKKKMPSIVQSTSGPCLVFYPLHVLVMNYVFSGSAFAFILFSSCLYVILSILFTHKKNEQNFLGIFAKEIAWHVDVKS